jgi:hypothetical protein
MKKLASILIALAAIVGPSVVAQADDGGCSPNGGGCGGCCGAGDEVATELTKFKKLVGEWATADANKDGQPDVVVTYKETAGGTAIIETLMPGTPKEMVTVYTQDEKGLLLTHYCLGNQPRMRQKACEEKNVLMFEFCDGTNIKDGAPHMRSLKLTFIDETHLRQEWTMWKDGKAAETIAFEFTKQPPVAASKRVS